MTPPWFDLPKWAKLCLLGFNLAAFGVAMMVFMAPALAQQEAFLETAIMAYGGVLIVAGIVMLGAGWILRARSRSQADPGPWVDALLLNAVALSATFLMMMFNPTLRPTYWIAVAVVSGLVAITATLWALQRLARRRGDESGWLGSPWMRFLSGIGLGLATYSGVLLWRAGPMLGEAEPWLQGALAIGILLLLPQIIHAATSNEHWSPARHPGGLAGFLIGSVIFWSAFGATGLATGKDGESGITCHGSMAERTLDFRYVNGTVTATETTHVTLLQGEPAHVLGEWQTHNRTDLLNATANWSDGPESMMFAIEQWDGEWKPLRRARLASGETLETGRYPLEDVRLRIVATADVPADVAVTTLVEHIEEARVGC